MKKKIAISGGSINGNTGAEAMLITTIKRIEDIYPEAEFGIFTPYYNDDLQIYKPLTNIYLFNSSPLYLVFIITPLSFLAAAFKRLKLSFTRNIFPKSIQFIWNADMLIDIAGVSFIDSRIKFIPFNVLSILPGLILSIPVVKFAQALGPFKKSLNRISARVILNQCNQIFARGKATFNHLQELGLGSDKIQLSTDIAFCHKLGDAITQNGNPLFEFLNTLDHLSKGSKDIIGICPSTVVDGLSRQNGLNYQQFIINIAIGLMDKGFYVIFFPNATKVHKPRVKRNNDIPLIHDIQSQLEKRPAYNSYFCYDQNLNTDGIKMMIEKTSVCLVSRFHAMIFALTIHKPVFILGWSHKYREIMEQFNMSDYVVDFQFAELAYIVQKIEKMTTSNQQISHQISNALDTVQKLSFQQIKYVSDHLTKE